MTRLALALCLAISLGCASHAPSSLSPAGVVTWQANESVVVLGTIQHVAIGLNGVSVCDPTPCHPLLSDANTRSVINVVEVSVKTIHAAPLGWKASALAGLDSLTAQLDDAGKQKLALYLQAARAVLLQVP